MLASSKLAEKRSFREDLTESLNQSDFNQAANQAWWNEHAPLIQMGNGDWWATEPGNVGGYDFYKIYSDRLKYGLDTDQRVIDQLDDDKFLAELLKPRKPIRRAKRRRR